MKDVNGREIQVGDKVRHIWGPIPVEPFKGESVDDFQARLAKHPKMSNGFAGVRTVSTLAGRDCIELDKSVRGIRVYLASFCEVVAA